MMWSLHSRFVADAFAFHDRAAAAMMMGSMRPSRPRDVGPASSSSRAAWEAGGGTRPSHGSSSIVRGISGGSRSSSSSRTGAAPPRQRALAGPPLLTDGGSGHARVSVLRREGIMPLSRGGHVPPPSRSGMRRGGTGAADHGTGAATTASGGSGLGGGWVQRSVAGGSFRRCGAHTLVEGGGDASRPFIVVLEAAGVTGAAAAAMAALSYDIVAGSTTCVADSESVFAWLCGCATVCVCVRLCVCARVCASLCMRRWLRAH